MPRTKKVIEEKKPVVKKSKPIVEPIESDSEPNSESDSEESVVEIKKNSSGTTIVSKPKVFLSQNLKSTDSDRIHLAQAINNFTLKSEQLMQEMKNFESFRESIARLDILIDTKKQEYKETSESLELDYSNKIKQLESNYMDKTKKLESDFADKNKKLDSELTDKTKKLESEFVDKKKTLSNSYEDSVYETKRKIAEDKTKQCELMAKELKMKFVKEEDYKILQDQVTKAVQDFNELKKTFDKQCDTIRTEESKKYATMLKTELNTSDLTHKANNAQLQAQVEQQKKEIQVLEQTILSLKAEIKEQRELTKEVAQASSRAQITQTIGKN